MMDSMTFEGESSRSRNEKSGPLSPKPSRWLSYRPLEFDEIRLLTIHPGGNVDTISCNISHAKLSEKPIYEALSYMWGLESNQSSLDIDGVRCQVRQNLWTALRALRWKDARRVVWVDALCINQGDDKERSHQVSQMGEIYSQASTVCVWLGLPHVFNSTSPIPTPLRRSATLDDTTPDRVLSAFLKDDFTMQQLRSGHLYWHTDWESLNLLCKLEYWGRLWIIQEVVLASKITLHWGDSVLHWEDLAKVLAFFEGRKVQALPGISRIQQLQTQDGIELEARKQLKSQTQQKQIQNSVVLKLCKQRRHRASVSATEETSLLWLLRTYQDANCVDVRDKIFGMHSFALPCCRIAVPVDYACTAYQLCGRLLEHHLHSHWDTSFLNSTITMSQEVHRILRCGIVEQSLIQQYCESGGSEDVSTSIVSLKMHPVTVRGLLGQAISYVSPPLRDHAAAETMIKVPVSLRKTAHEIMASEFGVRKCAVCLIDVVTAIGHPNGTLVQEGTMVTDETTSLDIQTSAHHGPREATEKIQSVRENYEEEKKSLDLERRGTQSHGDIKYHNESSISAQRIEANLPAKYVGKWGELLQYVSKNFRDHLTHKDCVLFFERGYMGMIGLASVGSRCGDFICRFDGSDVVALLRRVEGEYRIVGRAVDLRTSARGTGTTKAGETVGFPLDIAALQLLTRISAHERYDLMK